MGPELALLVNRHLEASDIVFIENWIARSANKVTETVDLGVRSWEFTVKTNRKKSSWFSSRKSASANFAGFDISIVPFAGEAESHLGLDVDPADFSRFLPYKPIEAISVSSVNKSDFVHRFIAGTALAFAHQFDSLIDMCGVIVPYAIQVEFLSSADPGSDQYKKLIDGYMSKIGRNFVDIRQFDRIYTQVVGRAFMESWMAHPDFHIVK